MIHKNLLLTSHNISKSEDLSEVEEMDIITDKLIRSSAPTLKYVFMDKFSFIVRQCSPLLSMFNNVSHYLIQKLISIGECKRQKRPNKLFDIMELEFKDLSDFELINTFNLCTI